MPCFHPLKGWKSAERTKNGKRKIVFNPAFGYVDMPIEVPCGQCIGCRLERSRQWAVRCVHEASLHDDNCFITLTYDDAHLPANRSLVKAHFQLFIKRLRKRVGGNVRYFHCGEYGSLDQRPHYHALLFGFDFPDKKIHTRNSQGDNVYKSDLLNELWGMGFCTIGALTYETCAYTARYVMKKVTGEMADSHYETLDLATGEIGRRIPEYITMSLKPAIGAGWYEKFKDDVFPSDFVVSRGAKLRTPKYYDRKLEKEDPETLAKLKIQRIKRARRSAWNNTPERLAVREEVKLSKINRLRRDL